MPVEAATKMLATVPREALLSALALTAPVAPKSIPILSCLKLETDDGTIRVTGTDIDTTVIARCPARITTRGGIAVDAKLLSDAIRSGAGEDVELEVTGALQLVIRCGSARFTIGGSDVDMFPSLPGDEPRAAFEIEHGRLRALLRGTAFACTQEEMRFQLAGVLLRVTPREIEAAGTDGSRLSLATLSDAPGVTADVLVPQRSIKAIERLATDGESITVAIGDRLTFTTGDVTLTTRLIDVNFPNYRTALGLEFKHSAVVRREALLGMLRRVLPFALQSQRVVFVFAPGRLTLEGIESNAAKAATDTMPIDYSGPALTVGISGRYVAEALTALSDESVLVQFSDANSAFQFSDVTPADPAGLHIVMPMVMK